MTSITTKPMPVGWHSSLPPDQLKGLTTMWCSRADGVKMVRLPFDQRAQDCVWYDDRQNPRFSVNIINDEHEHRVAVFVKVADYRGPNANKDADPLIRAFNAAAS